MANKAFPRFNKWPIKKLSQEKRRKIISLVLIIGFPTANFLAYHEARKEVRSAKLETRQYVNKQLEYFYVRLSYYINELTRIIPRAGRSNYEIRDVEQESNIIFEQCYIFINFNIGEKAQSKFMDREGVEQDYTYNSKQEPEFLGQKARNMLENLKKYRSNLEYLIKDNHWESYVTR